MTPEVENPAPTEAIAVATSERMQERVEVIQELLGAADRGEYRQRTQAAAERLNLSVSSIQRLVRAWKQQGVAGLSWRERARIEEQPASAKNGKSSSLRPTAPGTEAVGG